MPTALPPDAIDRLALLRKWLNEDNPPYDSHPRDGRRLYTLSVAQFRIISEILGPLLQSEGMDVGVRQAA
jgi:hypothetical protein